VIVEDNGRVVSHSAASQSRSSRMFTPGLPKSPSIVARDGRLARRRTPGLSALIEARRASGCHVELLSRYFQKIRRAGMIRDSLDFAKLVFYGSTARARGRLEATL